MTVPQDTFDYKENLTQSKVKFVSPSFDAPKPSTKTRAYMRTPRQPRTTPRQAQEDGSRKNKGLFLEIQVHPFEVGKKTEVAEGNTHSRDSQRDSKSTKLKSASRPKSRATTSRSGVVQKSFQNHRKAEKSPRPPPFGQSYQVAATGVDGPGSGIRQTRLTPAEEKSMCLPASLERQLQEIDRSLSRLNHQPHPRKQQFKSGVPTVASNVSPPNVFSQSPRPQTPHHLNRNTPDAYTSSSTPTNPLMAWLQQTSFELQSVITTTTVYADQQERRAQKQTKPRWNRPNSRSSTPGAHRTGSVTPNHYRDFRADWSRSRATVSRSRAGGPSESNPSAQARLANTRPGTSGTTGTGRSGLRTQPPSFTSAFTWGFARGVDDAQDSGDSQQQGRPNTAPIPGGNVASNRLPSVADSLPFASNFNITTTPVAPRSMLFATTAMPLAADFDNYLDDEEDPEFDEEVDELEKGFSKNELSCLPSRRLSEEMDVSCCICLGMMRAKHLVTTLRSCCTHTFHTKCIKSWLLHKRTCPLCKKVIKSSHIRPRGDSLHNQTLLHAVSWRN